MLSPIEWAPASRAPRLAASMVPGPPPVMIAMPASPTSRAVSRASAYSGWSALVRADPKKEAAGPTWASASKPAWSSAWIRSTRAASVSVETTPASCAPMISSSSVAGMRGWSEFRSGIEPETSRALARLRRGPAAQHDVDRARSPVASVLDPDPLARPALDHGARQVVRVAHAPTGHRHDHIAAPQSSARGRSSLDRVGHAGAAGAAGGDHAEIAAPNLTVALELRGHASQRVDRDREGDPVTAALGEHADHLSVRVEQRTAGVAGVDRGVGLDRVPDRRAVGRVDLAPHRGHDTSRDA